MISNGEIDKIIRTVNNSNELSGAAIFIYDQGVFTCVKANRPNFEDIIVIEIVSVPLPSLLPHVRSNKPSLFPFPYPVSNRNSLDLPFDILSSRFSIPQDFSIFPKLNHQNNGPHAPNDSGIQIAEVPTEIIQNNSKLATDCHDFFLDASFLCFTVAFTAGAIATGGTLAIIVGFGAVFVKGLQTGYKANKVVEDTLHPYDNSNQISDQDFESYLVWLDRIDFALSFADLSSGGRKLISALIEKKLLSKSIEQLKNLSNAKESIIEAIRKGGKSDPKVKKLLENWLSELTGSGPASKIARPLAGKTYSMNQYKNFLVKTRPAFDVKNKKLVQELSDINRMLCKGEKGTPLWHLQGEIPKFAVGLGDFTQNQLTQEVTTYVLHYFE